MKRNCNLELRLLTSADSDNHHHRYQPLVEASNESRQSELKQEEQKQLTIFYNGRVVVCDVAELQARAILLLASREMEDRLRSPVGSEPSASSPISPSQLYSPVGLPMKRSLQRFLKKRKHRIQATFPCKVKNQLTQTGRLSEELRLERRSMILD
ncbi:protein TIFY 5A [Populus alba x Populus x berolinensis]|nr:protein TIFY 5A [Populus alba x Populus x berolinensis]